MSIVLRLNSDNALGSSSDFTTSYPNQIDCQGWEIGLHSCTLYYSWTNISSSAGNNIIRYSTDAFETVETDITIPDGIYSITDLNAFIASQLFLRGHYTGTALEPVYSLAILPNMNTLRTVVYLAGDYQLDMSAGYLYQLLGLESKIYEATEQGISKVDVNGGIDQLYINLDVIDESYSGDSRSEAIYSFTPSSGPGSSLIETPVNMIYLGFNRRNFSKIRCRITDQNNNLIDFNGESSNITLHMRKSLE